MQVGPATLSLRGPVWAAQPRAPEREEKEEKPLEKWSRRVGRVAEGVTKIPKVLMMIPSFLKFAVFDAFLPLLGFAAHLGGVVGTVALGAAGALETIDGIKKKDGAIVLSGLGEMARGGYMGALSWNSYQSGGFDPGGLGFGFGLVHGGLNLCSGVVKMRRPEKEERVVGALEAGMGLAAVATLCVPGPWRMGALVAHAGLAGARSIYMHRDEIQDWRLNHREKRHELWEKFKDIFREEKEAPHAGP